MASAVDEERIFGFPVVVSVEEGLLEGLSGARMEG